MPQATLTVWIIVAFVAAITAVDVWLLASRGYKATISWTLKTWGQRFSVIPFLFGLLAGHLFFENDPPEEECNAHQVQGP